jgi:RNA polymerase primary sigma factor
MGMKQLKIIKQVTNRESASLDKYLHEISRYDLINADQEAELAYKIRKGDMDALNLLIRSNLRFVVSVSKQYQNQGLSLPDLINEGNIGLIRAARRFDETKGFKFISYAVWWIRQSILLALAEHARIVRLPLNKIGSINKVNQVFYDLLQRYEREPTPEEIAKELDVAPEDVRKAIENSGIHVSLDAPVADDERHSLYDILQNGDNSSPDDDLLKESLISEIERVLSTLPHREAQIIKLYYGLGSRHAFTLEEIGEQFELTRERVRQIKGRTIKILRNRSKILRKYL